MKKKDNAFALILGGGGAKGAYQIGAWKAFRELKIDVAAIVGTSVGAINGAVYIQNDFKKAISLWENITLENVVSIPSQLMKNGQPQFNLDGINTLKSFQKAIMKNKGLDTAPLKKMLTQNIDEDTIRKSSIEFGLVTYELNSLTPVEVFTNDIPQGKLIDYIIASASLPGFQPARINGKLYYDGGLHDNIPFELAYNRGYRRMIIVDISGIGMNRRPDIAGTETVYIKNSMDIGSVLEFNKNHSRKCFEIGYLDTMRVFRKNSGIRYFYNIDNAICGKLERIIFSEAAFNEYKVLLAKNDLVYNYKDIDLAIRQQLPKDLEKHKDIALVLMECAAEILQIERAHLYSQHELVQKIWSAFCEIEKHNFIHGTVSTKDGFFNNILEKIKGLPGNLNLSPLEYKMILDKILSDKKESAVYTKALKRFFPALLPGRIFHIILKRFFQTTN